MLQDSIPLTIRVSLSLKYVRTATFFLLVAHRLWRLTVVTSRKSSLLNAVCLLDALFNGPYLRFTSVRTSLLLITGGLSFNSHADNAHVLPATEMLLESF